MPSRGQASGNGWHVGGVSGERHSDSGSDPTRPGAIIAAAATSSSAPARSPRPLPRGPSVCRQIAVGVASKKATARVKLAAHSPDPGTCGGARLRRWSSGAPPGALACGCATSLWASKSDGSCLFRAPTGRDLSRSRRKRKPHAPGPKAPSRAHSGGATSAAISAK
jgi:hypothetical protein